MATRSEEAKRDEPKTKKTEERPAERASAGALRWFFAFDGWRVGRDEEEFVLA